LGGQGGGKNVSNRVVVLPGEREKESKGKNIGKNTTVTKKLGWGLSRPKEEKKKAPYFWGPEPNKRGKEHGINKKRNTKKKKKNKKLPTGTSCG